jgi:hypothetical protein
VPAISLSSALAITTAIGTSRLPPGVVLHADG